MEILTSKEAAELLRLSVPTIRGMAASGEIPATQFGDDWRFLRAQLIEYIAARSIAEQRHRKETYDAMKAAQVAGTRETIKIKRGRPRKDRLVNISAYG
jgi:excisionase family DNA binding protein